MRRKTGLLSNAWKAALAAAVSLSLSACFDLTQKVDIGRTGAGHYQVTIAASGIVGEALKEKPVRLDRQDHEATTVIEKDGLVTETSTRSFGRLADLKLPDEVISLRVLGHSFFGLGPAHVRFRRTFLVHNARRSNEDRFGRDDEMGSQVMASIFGDHVYVFSVTLPGSIVRAAPVKLGDTLVEPAITGDFFHGHTVTWTMPLYRMLNEKMLTFEADFSAYGSFSDSQSIPANTQTL